MCVCIGVKFELPTYYSPILTSEGSSLTRKQLAHSHLCMRILLLGHPLVSNNPESVGLIQMKNTQYGVVVVMPAVCPVVP